MKILQVVTYISPDGAYGGPVRVAINQAKALTDMGHDVILAAAAGGFKGPLPAEFDGIPVHLFPARRLIPKSGFAGLTSAPLLKWFAHVVKGADVVHVHLARDLVTLPVALYAVLTRKPLVLQTHGMIDRTDKKLAGPLDRLITRPVLRSANRVLYLTEIERQELINLAGAQLRLVHLPNGVTVANTKAVEQTDGPKENPEVLFLARLHERKRPLVMVAVADALRERYPQAKFSIVGPDEGEAEAVVKAIGESKNDMRIKWSGALPPGETEQRMRDASIYILPSIDEPFPMSVLEAMSLGIPAIVTDTCGLAKPIRHHDAGIVISATDSDATRAVAQLIEDGHKRVQMGLRARQLVLDQFDIKQVVRRLAEFYEEAAVTKESTPSAVDSWSD